MPPFNPRWKPADDEKLSLMRSEWDASSWSEYVSYHEMHKRLGAFLDVAAHCSDDEYWRVLGELWTMIENPSQLAGIARWVQVFGCRRPGREHLMMENERAALAALPESVTIYRGVQPPRPPSRKVVYLGLAWTVKRDVAVEKFARRNGRKDGILLTASVRKDCILAHFLSRDEYEVVIDPRRARRVERTPAN
jgi:hypothetical protein